MPSILEQVNQAMNGVIQKTRQSLVQVYNGQQGQGAGTIWHSSGMIITNAHVVRQSDRLKVALYDKTELTAQVIARNPEYDLAVLAVEAQNLPTIELGDSQQLQSGEWVMALGHPWGVLGAVTSGTVIGLGARLPDMPDFKNDWIAVNLAMRPGHSGGALIDGQGRLLGVNTMISGPEVGYAIPVHVVKQFLKTALV